MDLNGCVVCDGEIERTYHWLAEHYPNLCHKDKNVVHNRRQEKFRQHLENASCVVNSWPQWKKDALGIA